MEILNILSESQIKQYNDTHERRVRPKPPYKLLFPKSLIEQGSKHLQINGGQGLEQLILWSGYPTENGVMLTSLLLPLTEASWGNVIVVPSEQQAIVTYLKSSNQLMFVEAHTHGFGKNATLISEEDRRHPAGRQNGFLTLIIPGYANEGINFMQAGVWQCISLEWIRLKPQEVQARLLIVEDEVIINAFK